MKNKGFTLIELLVVIVIIGFIAGIGVVSFESIFGKAETNYYEILENDLILSANDYIQDHREEIPIDSTNEIDVAELINSKYIEQLKDKDGNNCSDGKVYVYRNEKGKIEYKVCLNCGHYHSNDPFCTGGGANSINITAKLKGTNEDYNVTVRNPLATDKNVEVTFELATNVNKYVIINTDNNVQRECIATNNRCTMEISDTGNNTYIVNAYDNKDKKIGREKNFYVYINKEGIDFTIVAAKKYTIESAVESKDITFEIEMNNPDAIVNNIEYRINKNGEEGTYKTINGYVFSERLESGNYVLDVRLNNTDTLKKSKEFYVSYYAYLDYKDGNIEQYEVINGKNYGYLYDENLASGIEKGINYSKYPNGLPQTYNGRLAKWLYQGNQVYNNDNVTLKVSHTLELQNAEIIDVNKISCAENLEYNGTNQDLLQISNEINRNYIREIINEKQTNAGIYQVTVKLNYDEALWSTSPTVDKVFNCSIDSRKITPEINSCSNKEYDGTNSANCSLKPINGIVSGDTVNLNSGLCTFNNKNVGTEKTITCGDLSLTGTSSTNYELTTTTLTKTGSISAKTLTATVTASDKEYDGTISATCGSTVTIAGKISGDTVNGTVNTIGSFDNKNVGNNKTVTCSGITLTGADAGNYTIAGTKTTTANITKKNVTAEINTCEDKAYDGTINATCSLKNITGIVSGESANASGNCTFNDYNVGANKTITCYGFSMSGENASNYNLLTTSAIKTANINARPITIKADNQTVTYGTAIQTGSNVTSVSNLVSGDILYSIMLNQSGKNVTTTGTITPAGAVIRKGSTDVTSNYTISYSTGKLVINKKSIAASVTNCSNKVYNRSALTNCTITPSGIISGDTVTVSGTCNFNNANVGTNKTVTCSSLNTSGTSAGNYNLMTTSVSSTADISAKSITATISECEDKTYNRSTNASCTISPNGVISGDTVTISSTCSFENANAGTGKSVTCNLNAGGASAGNYYLATTSAIKTANINKKVITASVASCNEKTYNRDTAATCTISPSGVINGDTVTASGSCAFASVSVGSNKTVSCTGISLAGTDKDNYSLSGTTGSGTGNINKKTITATVSANDKEYDGGTAATCGNTASLTGVISGDTVTASASTTGAFDSSSVGDSKTVTCSGITLAGTEAGNYTVATTATTTAKITKKKLTPKVSSCSDKTYDGTTSATCTLETLSGVISGETATLSLATGGACTFADANAGDGKVVTCGTLTITGTNSGNYTLSSTSAKKSASISTRSCTLTKSGYDTTYLDLYNYDSSKITAFSMKLDDETYSSKPSFAVTINANCGDATLNKKVEALITYKASSKTSDTSTQGKPSVSQDKNVFTISGGSKGTGYVTFSVSNDNYSVTPLKITTRTGRCCYESTQQSCSGSRKRSYGSTYIVIKHNSNGTISHSDGSCSIKNSVTYYWSCTELGSGYDNIGCSNDKVS